MLVNFFIVIINILVLIIGYTIIKKLLDARYINGQIIEEIKTQLENIIRDMNATTDRNITLIEEGKKNINETIQSLQQLLIAVEHKQNILNDTIAKAGEANTFLRKQNTITNITNPQTNTYTITKQKKPEHIIKENEIELEKKRIEQVLSSMNTSEQISYLLNLGWDDEKIKAQLKISSGEYELAKELTQ